MLSNDKRLGLLNSVALNGKYIDFYSHKKRRFAGNTTDDQTSDSLVMDMKDMIITNYSQLYLSTKFSDIVIKVEDQSMPCHKLVLGSQSDFFDRLFETQMLESTQSEVELKETDPQLFRLLLKLTYCGRIHLQTLDPTDVIRLYGLIQRYQFNGFEAPFLSKIKTFINTSNVWQLLETSMASHLSDCQTVCLNFLDTICVTDSLLSEDFFELSVETLKTILVRNSLRFSEVDLFLLAKKFIDVNKLDDNTSDELIRCVRLPLMRYEDLLSIVGNSGLVSDKRLMDVMRSKSLIDNMDNTCRELVKNRALFVPNINLCSDQFRYEVISGRIGDTKADDQSSSSQESNESSIESNEWPIVIRFGFPLNINHIDLKMSDKKGDRFSYKIQYSSEGVLWDTLYDYTKYTTANNQKLYFDPIVAQLFRICGTHQLRMDVSTKTVFDAIESFGCYYNKEQIGVERIDGLLANPHWIRSCVQQRVYHDTSATGVGAVAQEDKYYSREISSNRPIIVALDQPVMIDSFQFQLWDRDERAYSYVVEAKENNDWVKLADRSQDICRSLQTIAFNRRPISLVRVRAVKIHFVDCNEFRVIKFNFPKIT